MSKLDNAFEDGCGGTGEPHRLALSSPCHPQRAAAHGHLYSITKPPQAATGDHRSAGAAAAGQGLADATLPDAQARVRGVEDLQEPGIDALREAWVVLDTGTERRDRRGVHVRH